MEKRRLIFIFILGIIIGMISVTLFGNPFVNIIF